MTQRLIDLSTSSCLILLCFHDFKMFYSLWDIKPMIIDFSICRGIFHDNVYVLCLCPQDFFTSSRTYVQFLSAYVGYLSHTFVMELDLFIYFLPERISRLLQPKLLFTLFCVSFYLKEKYLSFISDSSLSALKSKITLFCLATEIFNQVLVQKFFFQMKILNKRFSPEED